MLRISQQSVKLLIMDVVKLVARIVCCKLDFGIWVSLDMRFNHNHLDEGLTLNCTVMHGKELSRMGGKAGSCVDLSKDNLDGGKRHRNFGCTSCVQLQAHDVFFLNLIGRTRIRRAKIYSSHQLKSCCMDIHHLLD